MLWGPYVYTSRQDMALLQRPQLCKLCHIGEDVLAPKPPVKWLSLNITTAQLIMFMSLTIDTTNF